ncbi:MAG: LysR family transcriptional regulator [bacterium]|nr:LysR family transcriptional regulator [bacterium]
MFSFLQLQYFISVAEEKSFSVAAKKNFISQQTLSIHIAQMEKEIGAPLFERTRPLTITKVGMRLLQGAREISQCATLMQRDLTDMIRPNQNTISVGVSHAHARTTIVSILERFREKCPDATVHIRELNFEMMDRALKEQEIELALTKPAFSRSDIKYLPIADSDDLYIYAPWRTLQRFFGEHTHEIHQSLIQNPSIRLLKDVPLSLPASGSIREIMIHFLMAEGIMPNIKYETTSLETSISICRSGGGITAAPGRLLLPRVADNNRAGAAMYGCYLLKQGVEDYALGISYLSSIRVSYVMQEFINVTKKYFDDYMHQPL